MNRECERCGETIEAFNCHECLPKDLRKTKGELREMTYKELEKHENEIWDYLWAVQALKNTKKYGLIE